MNKSDSIKAIAAALVAAQAEMPVVKMDSTNPFTKKSYASLGAVITAARPVLAKHGLSIIQFPSSDAAGISVRTVIMHASGEWMEETITLPMGEEKGKSQAQMAGSVITYLRRYSLSSVLCLYADEDSDGHQEEKKQAAKSTQTESKIPTLDKARAMKTQKGATLGDLTIEQLKVVDENTKDAALRVAARVIIAEKMKEGK